MNNTEEYCLAIDQGTFSTRAIVYDATGKARHSAQQGISLNRIDIRHVEQDAQEILASLNEVLDKVIFSAQSIGSKISTAGLATQRSSILAWKPSTGQAISPVLSWQDTRGADWIASYVTHTDRVRCRTGLRLSPHYGVSKAHWLLQNNSEVKQAIAEQDCVITPLASYLLCHLSDHQQINLDMANASRMLLCNIQQRNWDADLLRLFGIPQQVLANCKPTNSDYGTIRNTRIKINAVNGDQTAALYSDGKPDDRAFRVNLGTGAFVLTPVPVQVMNSTEFEQSGLLAGISSSTLNEVNFFLEGTVNGAGSALEWLEQNMNGLSLGECFENKSVTKGQQAIFINAVGNLGSPLWRSDIQPHFIDAIITNVDPRQAYIAVLESIVFLLMMNMERMRSIKSSLLNVQITKIEVSGGLSNVEYVCQALANLTGLRVVKTEDSEATSRGIAWLALNNRLSWKRGLEQKTWRPEMEHGLHDRYREFKKYLKHHYQAL